MTLTSSWAPQRTHNTRCSAAGLGFPLDNPRNWHACRLRPAHHIRCSSATSKGHNNVRLSVVKHKLVADWTSLPAMHVPQRGIFLYRNASGFCPIARQRIGAGCASVDEIFYRIGSMGHIKNSK
jgi:hypothetical protein